MRKICGSAEDTRHFFVDPVRRLDVASDRLLQHHARPPVDEAGGSEIDADRREEVGRRGQEEDAHVRGRGLQDLAERPVGFDILGVDAPIVEALRKARKKLRAEPIARDEPGAVFLDPLDVLLAGQVLARDADDAAMGTEIAVAMPVVQRRQQLAHRKVAGAAEEDEINRARRGHGSRLNELPRHHNRAAPALAERGPCGEG